MGMSVGDIKLATQEDLNELAMTVADISEQVEKIPVDLEEKTNIAIDRATIISEDLEQKVAEDYFRGDKGNDGYTPIKDIDYFDGERGEKGEQGIQGIQGIEGEKGDIGETGATGQFDFSLLNDLIATYSVTDLISGVSAEFKVQPLAPSKALSRYAVIIDSQDISGKLSITEAFTTVPITFESSRVSIVFYDERNYTQPSTQPTVITKLVKTQSNVFFELGALMVKN